MSRSSNRPARNRGSILIITMVILFAIAALVLTLNRQAQTQALASANDLASQQADAIERGAEQYALSLVSTDYLSTLPDLTDTDYAAVPVGTGFFWIIRPNYGDDTQSVYGLMDESSKINLNTVTVDALSEVPGMTDDIAGAIIDWRDTDDNMSTNGAESGTYNALSEPYNAKNSNFESVDEMLLLNGMTRELMYGDPTQAGNTSDNDPDDYYLAHGLSDFFTVWSTESGTATDGTTRVNITNSTALRTLLQNTLSPSSASRIMSVAFPGPSKGKNGKTTVVQPPQDLFELASKSGMTDQDFQAIENYVYSTPPGAVVTPPTDPNTDPTSATATNPTGPVGRININTAPRDVLLTLTGLTGLAESDIDALLAARASAVADNPTSISWVYDALGSRANGLGSFINGQGSQYSADIVAVSGNGRGYRHVKVVIDTSTPTPQIIFRHDITDRGWPLDPQVLASLRAGTGVTQDQTAVTAGGIH